MKITINTNEALVREGAANLQRGVETVGGRLFPNSLAVATAGGAEYRFVLFDRRAWAAAIGGR